MKKLTKLIVVLIICCAVLFSFTACDEVENGSKIQRMKIELEFLDGSNEVVDTQTAEIKLYLNFAPETTAHFMNLAENGFYNGVTISNVTSAWCEFGGYTRNGNELVKKDYTGNKLVGEFKYNGWEGNKLSISKGALVMKRNYDVTDGSDTSKKYDSAEATVMVMFNATAAFDEDYYCVFGMIESTDGEGYDSSVADADLDRSSLSSIGKFETISRLQDDDGNKTYYYEKASSIKEGDEYYSVKSDYYTIATDAEGSKHYYKGLTASSENELLDEDLTLFTELLNEKNNDFLVIPYTQVRIKSISKK